MADTRHRLPPLPLAGQRRRFSGAWRLPRPQSGRMTMPTVPGRDLGAPGPPHFVASAASAPASPTLLTVAGGRRAPGHQPDGPDGKRGTDVRAQPRRSGEGCWLCRVHRGLPSPALPGAKARSLLLSPHHTWMAEPGSSSTGTVGTGMAAAKPPSSTTQPTATPMRWPSRPVRPRSPCSPALCPESRSLP